MGGPRQASRKLCYIRPARCGGRQRGKVRSATERELDLKVPGVGRPAASVVILRSTSFTFRLTLSDSV